MSSKSIDSGRNREIHIVPSLKKKCNASSQGYDDTADYIVPREEDMPSIPEPKYGPEYVWSVINRTLEADKKSKVFSGHFEFPDT